MFAFPAFAPPRPHPSHAPACRRPARPQQAPAPGRRWGAPAGLLRLLVLLLGVLAAGPPGFAAVPEGRLPVPRFVSLRSNDVSLRTGPGKQYPIEWVFKRKDLPVEITAEVESWRRIRDAQGTEGWVHQSLLSGRRFAIITGSASPHSLRRRADPAAETVALLEPGVVARLMQCQGAWCRLEAGGQRGWIGRAELWGVYDSEDFE